MTRLLNISFIYIWDKSSEHLLTFSFFDPYNNFEHLLCKDFILGISRVGQKSCLQGN